MATETSTARGVRLSDDIWEQVDKAAARDGKTRNEWLKIVILSALWSASS